MAIGYVQVIETHFKLYLVEGRNNLAYPMAFVVWATEMCHAVAAAAEYALVDEPNSHRFLSSITSVRELGRPERDASPDSTMMVWDAHAWGMEHLTSLKSEERVNEIAVERHRKTAP